MTHILFHAQLFYVQYATIDRYNIALSEKYDIKIQHL